MKRMIVAAVLAAMVWQVPVPAHATTPPTFAELKAGFDPDHPGYGVDWYEPTPMDHDMAYATYTSAEAIEGEVGDTRIGADYLVAHAHDNPQGVGWGLGFAWKACAWQKSGVTNRADTIYPVYNALGVEALFNAYDLTQDTTYLDTAHDVLVDQDKYWHATTTTSGGGRYRTGWFPYSTAKANARCLVYNFQGYEMAVYARAYSIWQDPHFLDIAARLNNELWLTRLGVWSYSWWPYASDNAHPEDLVHEAFILHGYFDYAKYIGPTHDLSNMVRFIAHRYDHAIGNLWGVGMAMVVLAERGDLVDAERFRDLIPDYEYAPDKYGIRPGQSPEFVRHRSFVLYGLAELDEPGG
jgi:hypothetical protein